MGTVKKCFIILVVAAITDISLAACPKQKLLEDILSPANAERALQILRLASVGANVINPTGPGLLDGLVQRPCLPNLPIGPVLPSISPGLPSISPGLPNIAPAKQLLADFYQRRAIPRQPIVEVAPLPVIQEKVYPALPIPQPSVAAVASVAPVAPALPVAYPPPPAPCSAAPVPLVNPFLPAASPVSALAPPTSNLLPPVVPTQVRSHFLRKIPIPPPSL